jgi:predicted PurR-regulated permease PerM
LAKSFEEPLDDWNTWLIDKGILPSGDTDALLPDEITDDGHIEEQIARVDSAYTTDNGQNITLIVNVHNERDEILNELEVVETDDFFERAKKNIIQFFNPSRITGLFSSVLGFLGNLLITILSVLFIAFFFLKENGLFTQSVRSVVPNTYEEKAVHVIDQSAKLLIRYFVGVATQVTVITIFITTILSFLGFENALLIGFFAALMNVVPYLGPILGASFAVIIVVSANLDVSFYEVLLPKILKILGVFAVMQLIDNFLVQPNIFSKSVKAHPLEIFIVVLMGAKIGGVTGMILAIPAYTVIRVLAKVFLSEFKVVQRITKGL